MVARQIAPGRAVAVATLTTLLLTLLPLPTAEAQGVRDIFVVQGEAKIYQSNFHQGRDPTSFVDDSTGSVTLVVPVYNRGADPIENIPVYWFFRGGPARGGCVQVDLPAATTDEANNAVPGRANASIIVDSGDLAAGAYNISVHAFTARPAQVPAAASCGSGVNLPCGQNTNPTQIGGAVGCSVDPGSDGDAIGEGIDPTTASNNKLNVYFVKDRFLNLQIESPLTDLRWCPTSPGFYSVACQTDMLVGGELYNVTAQGEANTRVTYFETVVKNTGSWTDMVDWGASCNCSQQGWSYDINVTVLAWNGTRYWLTNSTNPVHLDGPTSNSHRGRSLPWDLLHKAGDHNVSVRLDPAGHLRRAPGDASVDAANRTAHVLYRDFTGTFRAADFRTSAASPYPYDGPFTIKGNITFANQGSTGRITGGDAPLVNWTVYIDNTTNPLMRRSGTFEATGAGATEPEEFEIGVTSNGASANYIPPGKHTLYAFIDSDAGTVELNETNNLFTLDIFIADSTKPTFPNAPKIVPLVTGANINSPTRATYFPLEPFNVYVNVTDDASVLTVIGNFSLDSNASVYRQVNATFIDHPTAPDYYIIQPRDFNFHNFSNVSVGRTENWTLRVTANDSFGNNATSSPVPLRLVPYPLHEASADFIIMTPSDFPNQTSIPWDGGDGDEPRWVIRVLPNMTGYVGHKLTETGPPNQQNYTTNLGLNITTAKNRTFPHNGSFWTAQTPSTCLTNATPSFPLDGVVPPAGCTPANEEVNNTFAMGFIKATDGAGPGLWNWSVLITDIAGHVRAINGTMLIEDRRPEIHNVTISNDTVEPGESFRIGANFSDDDDEIAAAYVNFTRTQPADGVFVNYTLSNLSQPSGTGTTFFVYNHTFETGRGKAFGLGGTFNVTFSAVDPTGNWNSTTLGNFTVRDEAAPTLTGYGVIPAVAEIGQNVTFWAKASDTTNVSVRLEVFRGSGSSELLFDAIVLNESPDGNFTATVNFTAEATHAWRLTPVDSVRRTGAVGAGTILVRDNLGPKFDVRSPSLVLDGIRYGSGTPRIEIAVFDTEGVVASSIEMKVAGLDVDYSIAPAPGNLQGFLVTYEVRSNRKFSHEDVVEVSLSATDNSSEQLRSFLNFSFTVDDVAPTARLTSITPAYRDQPSHLLNVSPSSRFTIVAEDNDGLPTEVDSIRYRILGGGPGSAETVYTGPLRINEAPGVYTGPRKYTLQFWAEDAVGNANRNPNITEVYVDETPPALFQFFPQGREINATFVDDRVGVNRSVVWYRANTEPYIPLPLVEVAGAWTVTLPPGVKGDRVSYYLQAWDRLDNTETFGNASAPYASFDVSNREPRVRITGPADGSRVFRTVDLTWEASDDDGDALVFTIYFKAPGRQTFTELAKIENSAARRYSLDTTRFTDGQYTFRVAAGDGGFVKLAETTISIVNKAEPVGVVSVGGTALPGETLLIKAEITKAEAVAEARLYLDGRLVDSYPMNDEGRNGDEQAGDGFYSVRVPIESAGEYSVEIFTQYREDGELKSSTASNAATFSAKLTSGYILGKYGAVIALIGLLAAVGIGVAVFVVMRRR